MKESPFLREIMQEAAEAAAVSAHRADIRSVIELRFGGEAATEIAPALENVTGLAQLQRLHSQAVTCPGLDDFRAALTHPPGSRRRKKTGR